MSPAPKTSAFDFSHYLDAKEQQILAYPQKWKWIGTCLTPKVYPLRSHRRKRWILDASHSHTPPQRELILAISGSTVVRLEDHIYPVAAGTVVLFDHYETHGLELPPGEKSFRHLWLHLPGRSLMSTNIFSVDETGAPSDLALKVRTDPFVSLIFDAWTHCVEHPRSALNEALLQSALATAFFETLGRPARQLATEIEKDVVAYIESYIQNHLSEPLTLNRLAKLAGYNPFSFHRIFKKYRQTTLHRFIMQARLTQARKLLIEGYNVESIAEAVGLSSSAVFSRFFKTHAQLPPSQWRNLNRYEIE